MPDPTPDDLPETFVIRGADSAAAPTPATHAVSPTIGPERAGDGSATLPHGVQPAKPDAPRERPASTLRAAVHVPGYEILGELGRGGMGVVYKATHLALKRTVALKMIRDASYADEAELARFRAEGEAVARLAHPNIVQIHEVGENGGLPYFALEFVEGGSLSQKLTGGPLTPREAARLVETLAAAVQLAHSRNIVHRDLKPANILMTTDGAPKITDFGLAKRLDGDGGRTQAGEMMGTPGYMAPEQASGKAQDAGPPADVYALGVILYECLSGRPPFQGDSVLDTLEQVRTREPASLCQFQRNTPCDLETICLKCLRKEPERRYASAEALAEDLHRWRQGEPIAARAVGSIERAVKWARRHAVASALATAVLLVTVLGVAGVVWKYVNAEQQKRIALHEADKAKKARDFLVSIFDPSGQRGAMTARQILDDAEKRIPNEFADNPKLQAELLTAIETVYAKMTASAPLAMILEARGAVQLQSTRDPQQRPVPQTLLYSGDRLTLAADAQVQLVVLSDLHKEWIRPGVDATIGRKGCEPADAVAERDLDLMMTFVRLPRGTFYMGWDGQKKGTKTEIKEDFEIAVHDVTQGQWQALMGYCASHFSRFAGGQVEVKDVSDEELKLFPVEQVSWDDAQEFIQKLNERNRGRGYLYRLPTEAEWEYACRGGAASEEECSHHFYFAEPTDDLSSQQANFNGGEPFGKAPRGKNLERTTRVGAYPPNRLGLCDMQGDVCQWCADSDSAKRVYRGGPWDGSGADCRAASRNTDWRTDRGLDDGVGFRLVRVPFR